MFELRRITAFVGTAAAATALGLAAIATAGTAAATATDDVFIDVIVEEGIQPPSNAEAIGVAHDVCAMLDGGSDLYDAVTSVSEITELDVESSGFFVGASIATYCPEHEGVIGA